jgi:simple sugar transport system ATP-binding protein
VTNALENIAQHPENAVEMRNITKTFGAVVANNAVCLSLRKGEILALLGENGSGKTTLMNMLSGIYLQDSGEILVCDRPVTIRSPKDAYALGIGMIHQHFKLVDVLSAAENIVLGLKGAQTLNRKEINRQVAEIAAKYGFELDPAKKVYSMSVSEKQTVEIVKALYRGAEILVLDEPTAVLTPQETTRLFAVLRVMKSHGKSIIIITHKLNEVMEISDRVAILRKGEYIATVNTAETSQQDLTEMMVGRRVKLEIDRPVCAHGDRKLHVTDLTCVSREGVTKLSHISFDAFGGEILGVAGVAGSGQKELCETITGLRAITGGSIIYRYTRGEMTIEENIAGMRADRIAQRGVSLAFVPEDRLGMGLVANMDIVDNVILRRYQENAGILINRKKYRHSRAEHAGAPPVRRQCAEGIARPRNPEPPASIDLRLPRTWAGYRKLLPDLQPAQRRKGKRQRCHLHRRGSGCADGPVRPVDGTLRRPDQRNRRPPPVHQRGDRPDDDAGR